MEGVLMVPAEERPSARKDESRDRVQRWLLRNDLCQGLPEETLHMLAATATLTTLGAGQVVFEDRDAANVVSLVATGAVKFFVRAAPGADFSEVGHVPAGNFFGEGRILDMLNGSDGSDTGVYARIVASEPSTLLGVPADVFRELVESHPLVMSRNLLKHSSGKIRLGVQRMFDTAIKRETDRTFDGLLGWLSRHSLDALTGMQIHSELLAEEVREGSQREAAEEIAAGVREFREVFRTIAELTDAGPARPSVQRLSLREWWSDYAPAAVERMEERGIRLAGYVEDLELVANAAMLGRAMDRALAGAARVMQTGEAIEMRVGRNHSLVEFHLSFRFPGLTEFVVQRLFEPFSLHGDFQDASMSLALARRAFVHAGGDAVVKRRSGEHLTLAFVLPSTHVHDS